jgi:AcrR family transcriptional regulator
MTRKYDLKRRAERQNATRLRIVEAAVALHESNGIAATTITEIADRAGVGRLTVYRHFPDQQALLGACSSHWFSRHPSPDPTTWEDIADPVDRLGCALSQVYAYFSSSGEMLVRVEQDAGVVPILDDIMKPMSIAWDAMRDDLAAAWPDVPGSPWAVARRAAIGHALAFSTWRSLCRDQGLTDEVAAELMLAAVRCGVPGRY